MHEAFAMPEDGAENFAWAVINTPLVEDELIAFCQADVERLLRINPYLEFHKWVRQKEDKYIFAGRNFSQEEPFDFETSILVEELTNGLRLRYSNVLKKDTEFLVESSPYGSKLTIQEHYYPLAENNQEEWLKQVDRSLTTWAGDIQKYLVMWNRWQWFAPWRWYMYRVWQRMKPSGRRIAYMFWWITLIEIALVILGAGIYWAEYS